MTGPQPDKETLDRLRADYQSTLDLFKMLSDFRFRLLAIVPTLSGAAVTLLSAKAETTTVLAVGLLGCLVLIGVVFYDLRNTQFYDAAVHRARHIEQAMGVSTYTRGVSTGGLFRERPRQRLHFWGLAVWHDLALALIYSASFGAWTFVVANAALTLAGIEAGTLAFMCGLTCGLLFFDQLQHLEATRERPQPRA